jgi:Glycosyl transferases group 1
VKIVLFDWSSGGHHPLYLRRFVQAVGDAATVVLAVPESTAGGLSDMKVEIHSLGSPRPREDLSRPLAMQDRELAEAELDRLELVASTLRPDHLVHMSADPVMRRLIRRPSLGTRTTLLLFRPRAHLRAYGTRLSPKEQARAWFLEYLVARWRRRPDAHALLTLDEEAARNWSRGPGARAFWLPEPPIERLSRLPSRGERSGCALYGALEPRKGVDLLAKAVALESTTMRVVIAGAVVEPNFEHALDAYAAEMARAGASVELLARQHTELEGLEVLAGVRCAVLPYPGLEGMSRVLVESATVRTPVVVHDFGILGSVVRRFDLGLAVDCREPRALRNAILELTEEETRIGSSAALDSFARRYSWEAFRRALGPVFGLDLASAALESGGFSTRERS